ncbi:MAG: ATP-binding protein [Candidatus Zixiibacteriota bacterium]
MKLNQKYLIVSILAIIIVPLFFGVTLYNRLKEQRLEQISVETERELGHLQFAVEYFFIEHENDLLSLSNNTIVRNRDDNGFTSFLNADSSGFKYNYGDIEKQIIDIFNNLRKSHPYINSVYMGRENGSFVRSHPRAAPTKYDPRERPWYIAGKNNPGKIVRTSPYLSVTTPDVNIGLVTALQDDAGEIYGVVGMDVTLENLSDYISNVKVERDGQIVLTHENGTIVACRDSNLLNKSIDTLLAGNSHKYHNKHNGSIKFKYQGQEYYLFHSSMPSSNLTFSIMIPENNIEAEIKDTIMPIILMLLIGMGLVSLILLLGLRQFVLKPLGMLMNSTYEITRSGQLDNFVDIRTRDEFGNLGIAFNSMIRKLSKTRKTLKKIDDELRQHRDHLEKLVENRTMELEESKSYAITQMKKAQKAGEELQNMVGLLDATLESTADAIIVIDLERRIIIKNKNFDKLCETDGKADILNDKIAVFENICPKIEAADRFDNKVDKYIENPKQEYIDTIKLKDGRIIESHSLPYIFDDEITGRVFSFRDITKIKKSERALQDSYDRLKKLEKVRDELTDMIIHDMRDPLMGIAASVDSIKNMDLDKDDYNDFMNIIETSSFELQSMVETLLDITRLEKGHMPVNLKEIDLNELAKKVISKMRPLIEFNRVEVEFEGSQAIVKADENLLRRTISNLLSNAIKYCPPESKVEVTIEKFSGFAKLNVKDHGPGIDESKRKIIFEKFGQIDSDTDVKVHSTGLGLSFCKMAMEAQKGKIDFESQPGRGSTFWIILPLVD